MQAIAQGQYICPEEQTVVYVGHDPRTEHLMKHRTQLFILTSCDLSMFSLAKDNETVKTMWFKRMVGNSLSVTGAKLR